MNRKPRCPGPLNTRTKLQMKTVKTGMDGNRLARKRAAVSRDGRAFFVLGGRLRNGLLDDLPCV